VGRVERELALGVAREDAAKNDQMIVHVKIDARATALNEVDNAALPSHDAIALGAFTIEREHAIDEDARDRCEHVGPEGHELAKLVEHREDDCRKGTSGGTRSRVANRSTVRGSGGVEGPIGCHRPSGR
jgi:hypothetical protein